MVTKKQLRAALRNRSETVEVLEELLATKDRMLEEEKSRRYQAECNYDAHYKASISKDKAIAEMQEHINVQLNSINAKDILIAAQDERITKLIETLDSYRRPIEDTEIGGVKFTSTAANVRIVTAEEGTPLDVIREAIRKDAEDHGATAVEIDGDFPLFGGLAKDAIIGENRVPTYEEMTADCVGECDSIGTPECPFFTEAQAEAECKSLADLHDNAEVEEEGRPKKSYAKTGSARKKTTNFVKEN